MASFQLLHMKQVVSAFCLLLQKTVVCVHQTEMFSCFSPKSVEGKMENKVEEEIT